ncbi:aspartate aminotransferase family protein [Candidatus Hecatella orcuttiae]|uniref:aspartate aminotransferase family protein n=1 Tax=Candidatus Hecatella orcuttiae TaxID=1935119 RepID=UPI0028683A10|nr:aspartate aminotransferase family protein [Candidatus Hecatella orcuttiae]
MPGDTTGRHPIVFEKGKNAVLTDVNGKEYIDCHGGYSVTNVGYCHPRIVKSIQEQVAKIWHVSWDYYLIPTSLLAEKLAQITPGNLNRTMFVSSGAEAVENAVKLAKKYAFKKRGRGGAEIVALTGSFHGRTSYAMALTGQNKYKQGLSTYVHPGVIHAPAPYCYRCFYRLTYPECGLQCASYVENLIKYETTGDVAAFISEPIFGEGGIIVPPDEYLSVVVKIFKEHGALYIADEIQTGFGRTGKMFAVELFNVEPDIMAVAKGIASGLPIAATIVTDEVAEVFVSVDHCGTYGGNAIVCAGALENINVLLEEKLVEKSAQRGRVFMEGLGELAEKYPLIGDVRGRGLMLGVELVRDQKTKEPAKEEANNIRVNMAKKGVLVNVGGVYGNVIRLQPPLCITEEQIKTVLERLDDSLKALS